MNRTYKALLAFLAMLAVSLAPTSANAMVEPAPEKSPGVSEPQHVSRCDSSANAPYKTSTGYTVVGLVWTCPPPMHHDYHEANVWLQYKNGSTWVRLGPVFTTTSTNMNSAYYGQVKCSGYSHLRGKYLNFRTVGHLDLYGYYGWSNGATKISGTRFIQC